MLNLVTVVVVPRERFSMTRRSLESIYQHTPGDVPLIYVDGGSPRSVRRYLQGEAQKGKIQLIRTNHYLSPNQARNIGFRAVQTKYTVFIDNDAVVAPDWLGALVRCAEETGAWLVGPLYQIGEVADRIIHMAGGTFEVRDELGERVLTDRFRYPDTKVSEVPAPLKREPTQVLEFHCMLVRTEVRAAVGMLDEGLLSTAEHLDLCLAVRDLGQPIYFEPASVVSYIPPPPFALSDIPFFVLRWSRAWNAESLRRFKAKWGVEMHADHKSFLEAHRRLLFESPLGALRRTVGERIASGLERRILFPLEAVLHNWFIRIASSEPTGDRVNSRNMETLRVTIDRMRS